MAVGLVAARRAERLVREDADEKCKWWDEYPRRNYVERARAQNAYSEFLGDVFSKPKRLGRSASLTNLTYVRETPTEFPRLKRTSSYSSLAPSLSLPQYDREAQRIVHTEKVYKPHYSQWYANAYAPARYGDVHREVERPYRNVTADIPRSQTHVPFFTFQAKRIFHDQREAWNKSYLHGSQAYLDRYVSSRLKADDFANRFAYSAYEWRKPQDHAFNRHFMYNHGVHVTFAPGIPNFYEKQALRRVYKATGRFYF
ncbi:unnamed protein product, partial [Mesorhabditis belari]|uniref:Uncharacterized protein n=1 Tax=Mesorhabditis belari TaxID=2138241 RepID=A0AAF3FLK5_9BILA